MASKVKGKGKGKKEDPEHDVAALTESYSGMHIEEGGPSSAPAPMQTQTQTRYDLLYTDIMTDPDIKQIQETHNWNALRKSTNTFSAILLVRMLNILYDMLRHEVNACHKCDDFIRALEWLPLDLNHLLRTLESYVRVLESISSNTKPSDISLETLLGKKEKKHLKTLVDSHGDFPGLVESINGTFPSYFLVPNGNGLCAAHKQFIEVIVSLGNQGFTWKAAYKTVRVEQSEIKITVYEETRSSFTNYLRKCLEYWMSRTVFGNPLYVTSNTHPTSGPTVFVELPGDEPDAGQSSKGKGQEMSPSGYGIAELPGDVPEVGQSSTGKKKHDHHRHHHHHRD